MQAYSVYNAMPVLSTPGGCRKLVTEVHEGTWSNKIPAPQNPHSRALPLHFAPNRNYPIFQVGGGFSKPGCCGENLPFTSANL